MSNFQSYQAMPDEARIEAPHVHQPARIIEGARTVTMVDGAVASEGQHQHEAARSSEASPFHGSGTIFSTARNKNGTPAMAIADDTLLTLPDGMQCTAKSAAAIGAITRNADGSYSEQPQAAQEEETPDTADISPIPAEVMDVVNAALEPLPQEQLDGFAGVGVGVAVGKLDPSAMVTQFAKLAGVSLEDAGQRVQAVAAVYEQQTKSAIAKHGIGAADAEAFFDWCRTHKTAAMQEAIGYQLHAHDVSRWAPLARQWMAKTAPSEASLKAAGLATRKSSHRPGAVEVFIQKAGAGWMDVRAAARAGYL
jgi:hypothetical protein